MHLAAATAVVVVTLVVNLTRVYTLPLLLICVKDPFELNVRKRASGTFSDPTLIPSMFEKRLIGCVCKYFQWRSNRVCRVCKAHGPSTVGGPTFARRCFFQVMLTA